jgi:serine/threonine protein kinase
MYNSKRKLGSGGSSDVFLALQCDDGMELALKRISLPAHDQQGAGDRRFETEVNLLKTRYGMPGLVNYLGHVVIDYKNRDDEPMADHFIALELMECDVKQLIHSWHEQERLRKPGHVLACQVSLIAFPAARA